jgi:hypothetical protein
MIAAALIAAIVAAKVPPGAVVSLVLMVAAAGLLTIGWRLAVHRRFEAHRWVQTAAVALNAAVVLAWMIRSFVLYVYPAIPSKLGHGSYAVATTHAVVGVIGSVLGVFVVLRASEIVVPHRWRFGNYKLVMRSSYALYMLGTATGVGLYVVAYIAGWK